MTHAGVRPAPIVWVDEANQASRHPDTLELDLSEARMAVWLSRDVNVQCDVEQDPAIARGDQFAVKLALQFRFR